MIITDLTAVRAGTYEILTADPAWQYDQGGRGAAINHYATMSLADICALPVGRIAAKNAFLFLWATPPNIREALQAGTAWGFTYKTFGFSWLKTRNSGVGLVMGGGSYTRANGEVCLLFTKGQPAVRTHDVQSGILAPRQGHSRKPAVVRRRIVRLCGDLPRIELFARPPAAPGWDAWGNEAAA